MLHILLYYFLLYLQYEVDTIKWVYILNSLLARKAASNY
jgi:hypothetical protein